MHDSKSSNGNEWRMVFYFKRIQKETFVVSLNWAEVQERRQAHRRPFSWMVLPANVASSQIQTLFQMNTLSTCQNSRTQWHPHFGPEELWPQNVGLTREMYFSNLAPPLTPVLNGVIRKKTFIATYFFPFQRSRVMANPPLSASIIILRAVGVGW